MVLKQLATRYFGGIKKKEKGPGGYMQEKGGVLLPPPLPPARKRIPNRLLFGCYKNMGRLVMRLLCSGFIFVSVHARYKKEKESCGFHFYILLENPTSGTSHAMF